MHRGEATPWTVLEMAPLGGLALKAGYTAARNIANSRTFIHPSEALPRWFTSNEPLIARGIPQSSGWTDVYTRDPIMSNNNVTSNLLKWLGRDPNSRVVKSVTQESFLTPE